MRKIITLGVMLLFLGMTISSSTGLYLNEQSIKPLSSGNILYVGGNGTGNYSKIQDAINDSLDGDTVYVFNGTYYENVKVNKSINFIGEDRETTIIDGNQIGIVVRIIAHGVNISGFTIQNCTRGANYAGIKIYSNHNIIRDNIIRLNNVYAYGIWLGDYNSPSNNNTITGNNICSNKGYGIRLFQSSNNIISGNNISKNSCGISITSHSNNNIIINNNISSNFMSSGILLSGDSDLNTIIGNTISSNKENGINLYYSNNNNITGNNISSNNRRGIFTYQSSNNYIEGNNIISNNKAGIDLENPSKRNVIKGNNISLNQEGIRLYSNNNNITGNNISSNNGSGIFISNYFYHAYNNTVTGNKIISNNGYGIYFDSSSNTITNNDIISNNDNGLKIVSSNNYIEGNNIISNNGNGILLWSSSNTITENNITSNSGYGIKIKSYGDNNDIYHNNFIDNTDNAYDEGDNIWDDGEYGNYWSDYKKRYPKAKRIWLEGIWDTPYEIPSETHGNNYDACPLIWQWSGAVSKPVQNNENVLFQRWPDRLPLLNQLIIRIMERWSV